MYISDNAIRRPIITIVVMAALVIFGLFALATLKTDEFPDVVPPFVSVVIPYPGASPETVEKEVEPSAKFMKEIDEVKHLGEVFLRISPNGRGKGIDFHSEPLIPER